MKTVMITMKVMMIMILWGLISHNNDNVWLCKLHHQHTGHACIINFCSHWIVTVVLKTDDNNESDDDNDNVGLSKLTNGMLDTCILPMSAERTVTVVMKTVMILAVMMITIP